jgi:uncharacterized NAD(P)/FAD-binding protein YdhS
MRSDPRTIVIVGAGFSGTAVATQLLRTPQPAPLRIMLIERGQFARGAAYARHGFAHLLNVPAGRMSANPLDPEEFVAYACRRMGSARAEDFLPRELYGDYLEWSLASAQVAAAGRVELSRVHDQVIAIERPPRAARLQLHLESGGCIGADSVVLAPGNPPPRELPGGAELSRRGRYLEDPWAAPLRFGANETLLLAGTGLTMADVAIAATTAARGARLHAISRHGLLPAPQTDTARLHDPPDSSALLRAASVSLPQLVRAVRTLAQEAELKGDDWREVISAVREVVPALWPRLHPRERRRFLRHVRAFWDVHRHRLASPAWTALQQLCRGGELRVHAGRILDLAPFGRRVRVTWQARGDGELQRLTVDRVINCTGPDYDLARTRDRLLRALLAQGLVQRDPLGLGLLTTAHGAVVDATGRAAANLYYIGPMLRATHWESTAALELRGHATRLARHLSEEWPAARRLASDDPRRFVLRSPPPQDTHSPLH